VPQNATVGLVDGLMDNGAIGNQEEPSLSGKMPDATACGFAPFDNSVSALSFHRRSLLIYQHSQKQ